MAFDMDGYVDVAERVRLAVEKWPEASFQNMGTKLVSCKDQTFVEVTVALYRTPDDVRPAIATAWEPIPGATTYTKDSEMMNAETSAMGRAVIAAGIPSKKVASLDEAENRRHLTSVRPMPQEPPRKDDEDDPWNTTSTAADRNFPSCAHGEMNYWKSPKTGKVMYFCRSNDENDKCEPVKE